MASRAMIQGGVVVAALVAGVVCCGLRAGSGDLATAGEALLNNRCILCNTYGASQMPRICGSCNNKFNNRCILCNTYGANQVPRICGSCNNKFNNRCILCNAYGASQAPHICSSCNNKH
ncbi:MAG: hypothetical protein KJS77_09520 [Planctomycetes bacterium]|nr:hypothetical protein [Planctomycetota bacterium]